MTKLTWFFKSVIVHDEANYLEWYSRIVYTWAMEDRKYILFNPAVQSFIESYSYCFNVKVTFYSLNLEELLVGPLCATDDYCSLIQQKLHVRHRCLKQDHMMCEQCKEEQQLLVYTCHGGLTEAVIPIHLGETLVCYAFIGQFRTTNTLPRSMEKLAQQKCVELSLLREAFLQRPTYDRAMLDHMFSLFKTSLSLLIETQALKLRQPLLVEKVIAYIDEHISSKITLDAVAQAVHMSRSSITHTLQAEIHQSFQQLLTMRRLATFELHIMRDPNLQIQQAALLSGYDDPLYFSRVYRKWRGQSPTEFVQAAKHLQYENSSLMSLNSLYVDTRLAEKNSIVLDRIKKF